MAEPAAGATPAPAATPPATPPAPPVTPPAEPEKVTVDKAEYEKLKADTAKAEARAAAAQSKADKLAAASHRGGDKNLFGKSTPQPTAEQLEAEANEEFKSAVGEITKLAMDPKYREVMDVDLTLRNLIATDPSQVLYLYAKDALDAADAKEIVETMLKERLAVIQKEKGTAAPSEEEKKKKEEEEKAKTTPPGGAPNPSGNQTPQQAMDAAMKITNSEDRRAAMIRAKMGNMAV